MHKLKQYTDSLNVSESIGESVPLLSDRSLEPEEEEEVSKILLCAFSSQPNFCFNPSPAILFHPLERGL